MRKSIRRLFTFAKEVVNVPTKVINVKTYALEVKDKLKPPVGNVLMYSGSQLKVMLVGGPNQRQDYHLNLGEELFIQLQGTVDVLVKEPEIGLNEVVSIPEGHVFRLPCALPHSPQRYHGTLGLVLERARHPDEFDGLRWYCESPMNQDSILYEDYFHCSDLGSQIKEAIEKFHRSAEYHTKQSGDNVHRYETYHEKLRKKRETGNELKLPSVFSLQQRIQAMNQSIEHLIDSEFRLTVVTSVVDEHVISMERRGDMFLWQMQGSSVIYIVKANGDLEEMKLAMNDTSLVNVDDKVILVTQSSRSAVLLHITNRENRSNVK